ncbi:uncharacterized protein LOC117116464 [Anneissia japonica]|uniref:uncharacterized protein LOC117116464 n=1 Tax=Anneissia japonica TaxID=1529436 RepID=UPI0014259E25|nr:uncharacterized protein LOC117116464 [Anneissia japonica]XP_033116407.1 uncharacterized protein LOC117116464 [Anneissia japonica]XP_033116408.1 uncharacterized protein LOC117116464 [Anneissia japonica]
MATPLPRLTPKETFISEFHPPQKQRFFRRSQTFVEKQNPLSKSWGGMSSLLAHQDVDLSPQAGTLPRINPLRPPLTRRTVTLETTDAHYLNESRTNNMKRSQYYRFHSAWGKPFYGNKSEQEIYRKGIREVLKDQMSGKDQEMKQQLTDKVKESEDAVNYDKKCINEDKEAYQKKITFLMQFRDENKRLIESREEQRRLEARYRNRSEQELLRYNPINWTQTLR